MRSIVLVQLLMVFSFAWSQDRAVYSQGSSNYSLNSMLTDLKGEPLLAGNDVSVDGSPFYSSNWNRGSITLASGKKFVNVMVKVNLHSDRVHYLIEDTNTERVASISTIKEVEFVDNETNRLVRFRCGYPVAAKNDVKTFYKVLAEGKATLLKQDKRILIEEKPFNSATITRRFDIDRDFFVFINDSMVPLKRTKSGLAEIFSDHQAEVEKYIAENKIRLKEDDDLAKVVSYYNSL